MKRKDYSGEKEDYSIQTEHEGQLGFTILKVWREKLIFDELNDPRKLKSDAVVKTLIKYSLYKYKDLVIDFDTFQKTPQLFDEIDLRLNQNEIAVFSDLFFEKHHYLISEPKTSPIEAPEVGAKSTKNTIKWPLDPVKKVIALWCKYYERSNKTLERVGVVTEKVAAVVSDIMENERRLDTILEKHTNSSGLGDKPLRKNQEIASSLEYQSHVELAITQIPELLDELVKIEKDSYESYIDYLGASNKYLGEQLDLAKYNTAQAVENSMKAEKRSNRAFMVAIMALIVTTVFGCFAMVITRSGSESTNKALSEKMNELKIEISQTNVKEELITTKEEIRNEINKVKNQNASDLSNIKSSQKDILEALESSKK